MRKMKQNPREFEGAAHAPRDTDRRGVNGKLSKGHVRSEPQPEPAANCKCMPQQEPICMVALSEAIRASLRLLAASLAPLHAYSARSKWRPQITMAAAAVITIGTVAGPFLSGQRPRQ